MNAPAQVKLGDCVRLAKGKPPAQQPYYGADSAWYLSPEYLRGAAACERAKPRANAVHVQDGNTILLWDGSNAGEVFLGREGMLASTMTLVSPDNRFTSDYFFFALKQWEPYLKGQTSGSGIPHVDKEVLGKLEITEFAKPEQSKIAEVLSTVDRAIAQTEALIAKQQRIKTGLMQDLLTRGIDEHGQLRSESTHAFKDSPLGRIPEGWEVDAGSKYFSLHAGIPTSAIDWHPDGDTLYLKVDDFNAPQNTDGIIGAGNRFNCPVGLQGRMLAPGMLVFPKRGAAIFLNRVEILKKQATLDPNLMGLSVKQDVLAEFLQLVLLHRSLGTICDNSGIPQINNKHLYPLEFAMPAYWEQEEIVKRTRQTERGILITSVRLRKLRSLKTALMQDLLTGKVRVTPLLPPAEAARA